MADNLHFSQSTEHDAAELSRTMRDVDIIEAALLWGATPDEAAFQSYEASEFPVTVRDDDGVLICMYGVAPLAALGETGAPWLLGTDKMMLHKKTLVVRSRNVIKSVLDTKYRKLSNVIWDKNHDTKRYLRAVGFDLGPTQTTKFGVPFRTFSIERD